VTNGKLIRLFVDDEPFEIRYGESRSHEISLASNPWKPLCRSFADRAATVFGYCLSGPQPGRTQTGRVHWPSRISTRWRRVSEGW
jgi:hypothetical protein